MTPTKSVEPASEKLPTNRATAMGGKFHGKTASGKTAAVATPMVKQGKAIPAKCPTEEPNVEKKAAVKITKGLTKNAGIESRSPMTAEQRRCMICEAAYYRAERRGFSGRDPAEDWVEAEAEIDRMFFAEAQ